MQCDENLQQRQSATSQMLTETVSISTSESNSWTKKEVKHLLQCLAELGFTRFPKGRYQGSKDGNFYVVVYACIQAYLKHHLPESDRSISSIHNKCKRLFNDMRLSLSTGVKINFFTMP